MQHHANVSQFHLADLLCSCVRVIYSLHIHLCVARPYGFGF